MSEKMLSMEKKLGSSFEKGEPAISMETTPINAENVLDVSLEEMRVVQETEDKKKIEALKEKKFNYYYPYDEFSGPRNMIVGTETKRDVNQYFDQSGYNLDDLKGKKIMDLGSGSGNFSIQARKLGLDIVPVDPMYAFKSGRDLLKKTIENNEKSLTKKFLGFFNNKQISDNRAVGAQSKNLPFKDGTFDRILEVYSAFHYCTSEEDVERTLAESLRVLKNGGEISVASINGNIESLEDDEIIDIDGEKISLQLNNANVQLNEVSIIKRKFKELMDSLKENPNYEVKVLKKPIRVKVDDKISDEFAKFVLRIKKL